MTTASVGRGFSDIVAGGMIEAKGFGPGLVRLRQGYGATVIALLYEASEDWR